MRLSFIMKSNKTISVPSNYRESCAAFLKSLFNSENGNKDLYNKWYSSGKNVVKPFTFSVYIPNITGNEEKENKFFINISSIDNDFIMAMYTAINKKDSYFISGNEIHLLRKVLIKEPTIRKNTAVFHTMSPIIVRKCETIDGSVKFIKNLYIDENGTIQYIKNSVQTTVDNFLPSFGTISEFDIKVIELKKSAICHYESVLPSNSGRFEISAPPEVLNLIHSIGIGARRSQGFGMIQLDY